MTVQEMVVDVFENLAEPSDLEVNATPGDAGTFSIALPGAQKILHYLNVAQTRIANWVYRDGSISRFKSLYSSLYWKSRSNPVYMVVSCDYSSITVLGYATGNVDDEFNGWVLKVTDGEGVGQEAIVVDSIVSGSNIQLVLESDLSTILDTTSEVTLYRSFAYLSHNVQSGYPGEGDILLHPGEVLMDIIRVSDVTSRSDLGRSTFGDTYPAVAYETGIPTEYFLYGNKLQFNAAIEDPRAYEIMYYRNPVAMVEAGARSELPEAFHEAIVMYATHKLRVRNGDYDGQYVDKQNLATLMESIKSEGVLSNEYENGIISVM